MRLSSLLVLPLFGLLASCASFPSFQENTAEGFQVRDSSNPAMFTVDLNLPAATDVKFKNNYAHRAIGETCAKRGFEYFNFGQSTESQWQGYCTKTSSNRSLALTLTMPQKAGDKFIVEDLNGKTLSKVLVGDALLKINSQPVISMAALKTEVFNAADAKKSTVTLEIERAGKTMTVEEPLADVANASAGPAELSGLRRLVP